jgi:arabinofuranosyltransferase
MRLPNNSIFNSKTLSRADAAIILSIIFFAELIKTAWFGDDAGFTFRSILNFLNGYGPNFNFDERVQSYTHPLWFLLLSTATLITKNTFSAAYFCSIALSITAFWMLLTNKKASFFGLILAGLSLILSKAFVDYSTSGLENPLTNLLLLFAIASANKAVIEKNAKNNAIFFFYASLVYLSRSDAIIFLLPIALIVIYKSYENIRKIIWPILLGSSPLIAWSLFSLIYYGSIFPNTAYAKLNTGIPIDQLLLQGGLYFIDSFGSDSITLPLILVGILIGISQPKNIAITGGIALYLLYVIYIGGDFMSGRFFATPMFLTAYILSTSSYTRNGFAILISIVIILGIPNLRHTLMSDSTYESKNISPSGIVDERGFYYQDYGLLKASQNTFLAMSWPKNMTQNGKPEVMCSGAISTVVHGFPDDTHFIIDCALADPLLSRLPINLTEGWRIGHYLRKLPDGYKNSIATNSNQIIDPVIHTLYEAIHKITNGDLWDTERLKTIFYLNFTDRFNPFKQFLISGIAFNQEPLPYFIARLNGLSGREHWGRWSDGTDSPTVLIELLKPLPKKFTLSIEAKGFNQNIGHEAIIRIGDTEKKIILEGDIKKYDIPFNLSKKSSIIEIIPSNPISPNQVDPKNSDSRKLGIGIKSMIFLE